MNKSTQNALHIKSPLGKQSSPSGNSEVNIKIAVIGLGYVGLPLARLFATKYPVVGFDINQQRVNELNQGHDATLEIDDVTLKTVLVNSSVILTKEESHDQSTTNGLFLTTNMDDIKDCTTYIITVPTPIDRNNRPDLTPLIRASETVGKVISKGDIVIYESTVYPGATEEDCIPVVERTSGLKYNVDFFAGYSPERINPGDKEHTVEKIKKVTSGSTPETGRQVDALYRSVITAGTHLAPTIKVAEAAKVIENSQRDINIAFVNELAKIFNTMGIDTHDVLAAAGTKWNFLPFKPGLVGGHCIGVDPYYLAQKAQEAGYHPEIILAGRRLNDSMGQYVASEVVKLMIKKGTPVKGAKALMLGITFKENCPDIRNTRAIDIYHELKDYGIDVEVYDPWASPDEVKHEYGIKTITEYPDENGYRAIILTVAHTAFMEIDLLKLKKNGTIIFDVKGILNKELIDARL
ncbi:MAG: nucleotide sugar dehydrogenase [Salinivirgaceae bacterium]|jgi:UDP-N-acetyl-D-galactosamine dehydrogenase|nr:nucleotide sugar dehydrogenase [Salinivirgaceae bacterium]